MLAHSREKNEFEVDRSEFPHNPDFCLPSSDSETKFYEAKFPQSSDHQPDMFSSLKRTTFICEICDSKYFSITDFSQHMLTHTGEKK